MLALEKKLINCVFLLKCDGNGKGQIAVAAFAVVRLLRELDKGECIKITYVQNASALSACVNTPRRFLFQCDFPDSTPKERERRNTGVLKPLASYMLYITIPYVYEQTCTTR